MAHRIGPWGAGRAGDRDVNAQPLVARLDQTATRKSKREQQATVREQGARGGLVEFWLLPYAVLSGHKYGNAP